MRTFKMADLLCSIVLITGFTFISIIRMDQTFLYGYLVVGGWQVVSMVIHAFKNWFNEKGSTRKIYHWVVTIIIALGITAPLIQPFFFIFYIMLFFSPVLAVFYTLLCLHEVKRMNRRPLALLK